VHNSPEVNDYLVKAKLRQPRVNHSSTSENRPVESPDMIAALPVLFGLYKIFFYFEAFVHESIILSFPSPTCIGHTVAIQMHNYWAVYEPPSDLPFVCHIPCNIGKNNIV